MQSGKKNHAVCNNVEFIGFGGLKVKTYFHIVGAQRVHFTETHMSTSGKFYNEAHITNALLCTAFIGRYEYACTYIREGSVRKIQTKNVKRRERKSRTYSYYKGDLQDSSRIIISVIRHQEQFLLTKVRLKNIIIV